MAGRPLPRDGCARSRQIESYRKSLSADEHPGLKARTVANAERIIGKQYHDGKERGGTFFETAKRSIINAEIRKILAAASATTA